MRWPPAAGGIDVRLIPVSVSAGGALVTSRACWLLGWTLATDQASGDVVLTIVNGAGPGGDPAGAVTVAAPAGDARAPGLPGIPCDAGLWLQASAGTLAGAVIIGTEINP